MAEPQYKRIFVVMEKSGESLTHLRWFSSKLAKAHRITCDQQEWVRLDRIVKTDKAIFENVALSIDYEYGLDDSGNIYVTKDHAINIKCWEHERTEGKLDVARNWIVALLLLIVYSSILTHCSS